MAARQRQRCEHGRGSGVSAAMEAAARQRMRGKRGGGNVSRAAAVSAWWRWQCRSRAVVAGSGEAR